MCNISMMNQSILQMQHEGSMHPFCESKLCHKSKFSIFYNIYVSDTELLEMFTYQIIFRRKTIILLLE